MIQEEIEARLIAEWGFQRRDTAAGPKLAGGRCPACGEPEAYCPPANPYVVICPRANKCGVQTLTKNLYPELFQEFSRRNPATRENPNATADAYLTSRGMEPARIAGWYAQGKTNDPEDKTRTYSTVQFTLANGVAYHRLIGKEGKNKNKIVAAFRGSYWAKPGFDPPTFQGDLYMVEGVLNAVSLEQAGCATVANLSSGHVPTDLLGANGLRPGFGRVVIAQDADPAGEKSARILAAACKERGIRCAFAFPPKGSDWNDLLVRGELTGSRASQTLSDALWRGSIFGAESAVECFIVWNEKKMAGHLFEFQGGYWSGEMAEGGPKVRRVATFILEPEVVIAQHSGGDTDHSLRAVLFTDQRKVPLTLSGKELSSMKDFKSAVRTRAWGHWTGSQFDLDALNSQIDRARPPIVLQTEIIGWNQENDCYFFPGIAYNRAGKAITPDINGYFTIPGSAVRYHLNHDSHEKRIPHDGPERLPEVLRGLWKAFGSQGLTVVGFAAAALFANQFANRPATRFFPFMSLYGEPGTGKTSVLMLMHRLLGREVNEGLSLNPEDTAKGIIREIAKFSGVPVALLEMDKVKASRFGFERLLPLYNRGDLQIRANKTHGLDTNKTEFKGALMFTQNIEQFTGEAQKSRIVSVGFLDKIGGETLQANQYLLNMPFGALAAFRHQILSHRGEALQILFDAFDAFEARLSREGIGNARVNQNHALVMAGVQLAATYSLSPEEAREMVETVYPYMLEIANRKISTLFAETDYLALFADTVARLISDKKVTNYSPSPEQVWINLSEVKRAFESDYASFDFKRIFEELESSGKLVFRNESRWTKEAGGRSLRLYGFERSLFYP